MQTITEGTYDEALERLHRTGPEFDGWMSNHGPMVVEALARRGAAATIHRWTDDYSRRLDQLPAPSRPLVASTAAESLGDHTRLGDWIAFFERRLDEQPWRDVLATWWSVLLPGIAAGATHGVIRVGHATVALRAHENEVRVRELAHGLGYWAARWQPVAVPVPQGTDSAASLVTTVPRVAHQEGGIRDRLAQLPGTRGWAEHGAALRAPVTTDDVRRSLDDLVDAVVLAYPRIAVGQPTMLVHAATSAVLAAYRPAVLADGEATTLDADDIWAAAVDNGGAHVVKLADTALDVLERTGDPRALAAVRTAVVLDA